MKMQCRQRAKLCEPNSEGDYTGVERRALFREEILGRHREANDSSEIFCMMYCKTHFTSLLIVNIYTVLVDPKLDWEFLWNMTLHGIQSWKDRSTITREVR